MITLNNGDKNKSPKNNVPNNKELSTNNEKASEDESKKKDKIKVIEVVTYEDNKYIFETQIDRKDNDTPKILIYNKDNKEIECITPIFKYGDISFKSIGKSNSLLKNGCIYFHSNSGIIEFKDNEGNTKTTTKIDIVNYLKDFIRQYVDCSEEYLTICSRYILLTYYYRDYEVLPYIRVIGDYGSGKSQILKVVGKCCYNPMILNGSSTVPTIFRVIEKIGGTLIFDEADIKGSDTTNELIKILNNGFQKGMPVLRCDVNDFNPDAFNVFCPKLIGGRMEFSDKATESRCLTEIMKQSKRTDIKKVGKEFEHEVERIRNTLMAFRFKNIDNYKSNIDYDLSGLEPRLKQIIEPLLSIIDLKEEGEMIIDRAKKVQNDLITDRQYSLDGLVFKIIFDSKKGGSEKIHIKLITQMVNDDEGNFYNKLKPRKVASLLRQNGITSTRDNEGYYIDLNDNLETLEQIFRRYCFE